MVRILSRPTGILLKATDCVWHVLNDPHWTSRTPWGKQVVAEPSITHESIFLLEHAVWLQMLVPGPSSTCQMLATVPSPNGLVEVLTSSISIWPWLEIRSLHISYFEEDELILESGLGSGEYSVLVNTRDVLNFHRILLTFWSFSAFFCFLSTDILTDSEITD